MKIDVPGIIIGYDKISGHMLKDYNGCEYKEARIDNMSLEEMRTKTTLVKKPRKSIETIQKELAIEEDFQSALKEYKDTFGEVLDFESARDVIARPKRTLTKNLRIAVTRGNKIEFEEIYRGTQYFERG